MVAVDQGPLERTVANVVVDAAKNSGEGERVPVSASTLGDRIELRVVDRGSPWSSPFSRSEETWSTSTSPCRWDDGVAPALAPAPCRLSARVAGGDLGRGVGHHPSQLGEQAGCEAGLGQGGRDGSQWDAVTVQDGCRDGADTLEVLVVVDGVTAVP
ncbi:hypothetical protein GCM10010234_48860 [Streptomyces hawaiiensis]